MNNLNKNIIKTNELSYNGATFEILEYNELSGASSTESAMHIFFLNQAGLKLKQVKITLNNSSIKTEAGALYYYKGNIQSQSNIGGVGGLFKKAISGALTNESTIKPTYSGTGEIILEPSYKYYMALELSNDSIIVDKGMLCSQKNISSTVLGGEGLFQLELYGCGVVILECEVPQSEIVEYKLTNGEELKVDGNFAIARTSGVSFSVTKSDKSLIGSALNGEGLLNTFKGEGTVWLAPTQPIYRKMMYGGMPTSNNSMNNIE